MVGAATLPSNASARSTMQSWSLSPSRARPSGNPCGRPSPPEVATAWMSTSAHRRHSSVEKASLGSFVPRCIAATAESAVQLVTVRPVSLGRASPGCSGSSGRSSTTTPSIVVSWRQGRCLPYGEGITYWALGEMVKAPGGDPRVGRPGQARSEARESPSRPSLRIATQAEWLERAPGQPRRSACGTGRTRASCSPPGAPSWSRSPVAVPLVLVFEDLHWADDALIAIRRPPRRLGDRCAHRRHLHRPTGALRAPLRVGRWQAQCHQRGPFPPLGRGHGAPCLRAARPRWRYLPRSSRRCSSSARAATRSSPRSTSACSLDREILVRRGRTVSMAADASIPLPETIQASIAARLDTLPPTRKVLLQDAAVIGKVFWSGALASDGRRRARLRVNEALARARPGDELIRPLTDVECRGRRPSTRSGTRWCATSPTARSRVPRGSRSTKRRRRGCARRPGIEPRMSPSCWRITTSKPSRWRRPLASTRWSACSGLVRSKRSRWRALAPCRSTPGRPTSSTVVPWSCRCRDRLSMVGCSSA